GSSCGSVIDQNCRQGPAPSSAAASYCCGGMFCMAARYRRKLNPTVHHTVAITIAIMFVSGFCNQAIGSRPSAVRMLFAAPICGLKIHTQICEMTVDASR